MCFASRRTAKILCGEVPMDTRKLSILVADGNERFRSSLRKTLEHEGYGIVPAESGREALDVVRREPIHIVVMDVRLPDYSGYEVYHAIKDIRDVFLPCIFTALEMTAQSIEAALSEDAVTIMPKPVDMPRLVHAVGWSVERYYSRRNRIAPSLYPRRFGSD